MEKLAEGSWRVNGTMRLEDFRRGMPATGRVEEVDTMGGLAGERIRDSVPTVGESVRFAD